MAALPAARVVDLEGLLRRGRVGRVGECIDRAPDQDVTLAAAPGSVLDKRDTVRVHLRCASRVAAAPTIVLASACTGNQQAATSTPTQTAVFTSYPQLARTAYKPRSDPVSARRLEVAFRIPRICVDRWRSRRSRVGGGYSRAAGGGSSRRSHGSSRSPGRSGCASWARGVQGRRGDCGRSRAAGARRGAADGRSRVERGSLQPAVLRVPDGWSRCGRATIRWPRPGSSPSWRRSRSGSPTSCCDLVSARSQRRGDSAVRDGPVGGAVQPEDLVAGRAAVVHGDAPGRSSSCWNGGVASAVFFVPVLLCLAFQLDFAALALVVPAASFCSTGR